MNHTDNNRSLVFFFFVITIFVYQSAATLLAMVLYFLAVKLARLDWRLLFGIGVLSVAIAGELLLYHYPTLTIKQSIFMGFNINFDFWKMVFKYSYGEGLYFLWVTSKYYLLGLPLFFLGLMSLIQLIPITAHESLLRGVSRAKSDSKKEIKPSLIEKKLKNLSDDEVNGTLLGISKWSGQPIVIPDYYLNQMLLVLGTTGGGKTVTLRRFYGRALKKGYPLIIVDGKPTQESVSWIKNQAKQANRPFFGFNCDEYQHYDPLSHGGHTELKDKIMTLKDDWENDYYKTIAEDYLQTAFEVLLAQNEPYDLRKVVNCLDSEELVEMVRLNGNDELKKRVKRISQYEKKDITGLQAHLNVLLNSEMGEYFKVDNSMFSIQEVIASGGVAYFALPALRYSNYAKVMGKLVINDIKTVIDRAHQGNPLFISFDEFSVFAGEQVLNLANMGRSKGVHAMFGTQGISDLKTISPEFSEQLLNCCNSIICHRVNDLSSIEAVTSWVGTVDAFAVTAQVDSLSGGLGAGSVRRTKEFIIHPDEIKQKLLTGEAFYMTKIDRFSVDKVKVIFR